MTGAPQLSIAESTDSLAADVAARARDVLAAAIRDRAHAHLVVTGGSILERVFAALAAAPGELDWSRVHVWWGDERYVPTGSDERNDRAARQLLFAGVPAVLHPMPASDQAYACVEDAANAYAADLAAAASSDGPAVRVGESDVPAFDLLLLGVGPDGHCASLFPGHPGTAATDRAVIAVHESPKPPPTRLSLTFPALDAAAHVWFVVAGSGKADAVAKAHSGMSREQLPSAGPRGRQQTIWYLDRAAAAQLPS